MFLIFDKYLFFAFDPNNFFHQAPNRQTQTTKGCLHSHLVISTMKRPLPPSVSSDNVEDRKMKKKVKALDTTTMWSAWRASMFDDNLLFEVLKHIDTSDVGMHKQAVTQGSHGRQLMSPPRALSLPFLQPSTKIIFSSTLAKVILQ